MKKILLLLLMIPFFTFAQNEVNNFKVNDQRLLVWQKVFESDVNPDQLFGQLLSTGFFKDVNKTDSTFFGLFQGIEPDYKGYGSSEMSTPIYIARSFINGGVRIEIKDGRYRVTLQNLTLEQKYSDGLSKQGEKSKIEGFALSNDKIKSGFSKKPAAILDYTFNKIFKVSDDNSNDDW